MSHLQVKTQQNVSKNRERRRLGEVHRLRGLRHAALLHHELLVHHVRVAVVHAAAQEGVAPLQNGPEGRLRAGGEVTQRADVARDVLRKAHDPRVPLG